MSANQQARAILIALLLATNPGQPAVAAGLHLSLGLLQSLPAEELRQLPAGDETFPVLYQRDRSGRALGAVVLLHGYLKHMDWEEEIRTLRLQLAEFGWDTLSLPLPESPPPLTTSATAAPEAEPPPEAPAQGAEPATTGSGYDDRLLARLRAAMRFLREQGQTTRVLIGQNEGAVWATQYFLNSTREEAAAVILLNAENRAGGTSAQIPLMLEVMGRKNEKRPLLDLILPTATEQQISASLARAASARREKLSSYRKRTLLAPALNLEHARAQGEDALTRTIRGWLHSNAALLPSNE